MGIISSMWSVASVAGPLLGGVFTQVFQAFFAFLEKPTDFRKAIGSPGDGVSILSESAKLYVYYSEYNS